MTTTYYVNDLEVVTLNDIGMSIERYNSQDYWKVRLYLSDVFSPTVSASLVPNTTSSIKAVDSIASVEFSGTLLYWASTQDYSYVDIVNASVDSSLSVANGVVRSGSGTPSSGTGLDGDFYIDTDNNLLYGPKTTGAWGTGISLVGPTGATGSRGLTGATGATGATGDTSLWRDMPDTITRISDTQFTIPDASNNLKLDKILSKGFLIRWYESGVVKSAKVILSSYSSDTVTVDIVGSVLGAGFADMQYCHIPLLYEDFLFPGSLPSTNATTISDISKAWYPPSDIYIFSADMRLGTAGSGSRSNDIDINIEGSTKFTTKLSCAASSVSDLDVGADLPLTQVNAGSSITIDIDNSTSTPGRDLSLYLYYCPVSWIEMP